MHILSHRATGNLGDAIQIVALEQLLGGCSGYVNRDAPREPGLPLIVNGWLGDRWQAGDAASLYAGIHLATPRALERYRTAAAVYTTRLHVILPCLAFGTPVTYAPSSDPRFSILAHLGLPDAATSLRADVNPMNHHFRRFLGQSLPGAVIQANPTPPSAGD